MADQITMTMAELQAIIRYEVAKALEASRVTGHGTTPEGIGHSRGATEEPSHMTGHGSTPAERDSTSGDPPQVTGHGTTPEVQGHSTIPGTSRSTTEEPPHVTRHGSTPAERDSTFGEPPQVTGHGTNIRVDTEPNLAEYVRLNLLSTQKSAKAHMDNGTKEFLPKFTHDFIKVKIPENIRDVSHWGKAIVQDGKHKGRFKQ